MGKASPVPRSHKDEREAELQTAQCQMPSLTIENVPLSDSGISCTLQVGQLQFCFLVFLPVAWASEARTW